MAICPGSYRNPFVFAHLCRPPNNQILHAASTFLLNDPALLQCVATGQNVHFGRLAVQILAAKSRRA